MNLYKVNIHVGGLTGIYGETLYVPATSAKTALDKAYRKFDKRYPDEKGTMIVHQLELVEENY